MVRAKNRHQFANLPRASRLLSSPAKQRQRFHTTLQQEKLVSVHLLPGYSRRTAENELTPIFTASGGQPITLVPQKSLKCTRRKENGMRDYAWLPGQLAPDQMGTITFWIVFARFEYALKREGYAYGDQGSVWAHWDRLAAELNGTWNAGRTAELQAAADYFNSHPPRKQVFQNNMLEWADSVVPNHEPELKRLLIYVRRVRNNLFHGGKFNAGFVAAPERDTALITNSLIVLDECLTLCEQVLNGIFVRFMENSP